MDALLTVFWGIVVLVVLVVIHELGHFVAARSFGVRVTEFMIGLPGPNIGFEHNGTRYGITAIPLGGYNRITGMEYGPEDPNLEEVLAYVYRQGKADVEHTALACDISQEDAEMALIILDGWGSINKPGRSNHFDQYAAPKTQDFELGAPREVPDPKALLDSERKQTYRGLPFWKRLVVLFGGPVFNVLLAFILFMVIFCGLGVPAATNTLSSVVEGSPAQQAGIMAGDTITSVDGTEVSDWTEFTEAVSELSVGQQVEVGISRDGQAMTVQLTVGQNENGDPQFGVIAGTENMRVGPGEALGAAWQYLVLTVQSYASLINPVTAAETIGQSTSVVGIAVVSKNAAESGIVSLLYILAVISLSLGIVNLLPLPPLDGGKIVVECIQKVIGRDLPERVVSYISFAVIALLLLLFVVLLQQDIQNFILGG